MKKYYGKIKEVDEKAAVNEEMKTALIELRRAFINVLEVSSFTQEFNNKYPFDLCFTELTDKVIEWVASEVY